MDFDGFWWILMNFDGFWWILMDFGDAQKLLKTWSKINQKSIKNWSKSDQKSAKNRPKIGQNRPKSGQKVAKIRSNRWSVWRCKKSNIRRFHYMNGFFGATDGSTVTPNFCTIFASLLAIFCQIFGHFLAIFWPVCGHFVANFWPIFAWFSSKIHQNPTKSINPSKSIKIHQNPSKSIKIHQNLSKSNKIHLSNRLVQNPFKSKPTSHENWP